MDYFLKQIEEIRSLNDNLDSDIWRDQIKSAIELTIDTFKKNKKILFAGNGGSAADAQHMAGEFVSRFEFDRPGLPGIALTVDSSILTACGNDYGYDTVFSRQIEALGDAGDLLWVYTTSGKSKNILMAMESAVKKQMKIIAFCGKYTKLLVSNADLLISIDTDRTPRIQEWHLISGHIICGAVEKRLFG